METKRRRFLAAPKQAATTLWGLNTFHLASGNRSLSLFNFIVCLRFFSCALIAGSTCLLNCFSLRDRIAQYATVINWLINTPTRICDRIPTGTFHKSMTMFDGILVGPCHFCILSAIALRSFSSFFAFVTLGGRRLPCMHAY